MPTCARTHTSHHSLHRCAAHQCVSIGAPALACANSGDEKHRCVLLALRGKANKSNGCHPPRAHRSDLHQYCRILCDGEICKPIRTSRHHERCHPWHSKLGHGTRQVALRTLLIRATDVDSRICAWRQPARARADVCSCHISERDEQSNTSVDPSVACVALHHR